MEKKKPNRIEYAYWLLFGALFLVMLFLRMYRLDGIPEGIHVDEAGMAYDAWSMLQTGTDRYYNTHPVYLINYGGGQSALYAYVCMGFFRMFGLQTWVLRLPAVLFGAVTFVFGAFLLKKYFGRLWAALGAFFIAVFPYFIMQARLGMDCNLFLGASTLALYLLSEAVEKRKLWLYALSGAAFGLCLYTYALSYLVLPIFLLLTLLYLYRVQRLRVRELLALGIPMGLLALPLITFIVINTFELPEVQLLGMTIPRMPEYRGAELGLGNILNNIPVLIEAYFFEDLWPYNSVAPYYTMYVLSLPFVYLGIQRGILDVVRSVRERKFRLVSLLLFWLCAQTIMGLLITDPNVNRMNGVYLALLFFSVYGVKHGYELFQKKRGRILYLGAVVCAYGCFFVSFARYYYGGAYVEDYHPMAFFADTYTGILDDYAEEIGEKTVYVNAEVNAGYIYYALGEQLTPEELALPEKGTKGRENVQFSLPEEVDENGFYIVKGSEGIVSELEEAGFVGETAGFYEVWFRAQE